MSSAVFSLLLILLGSCFHLACHIPDSHPQIKVDEQPLVPNLPAFAPYSSFKTLTTEALSESCYHSPFVMALLMTDRQLPYSVTCPVLNGYDLILIPLISPQTPNITTT
ncbi:hypothetical protein B0T09DRAFT_338413 [Sordaria sp. MPI-SDFR-AT-0083]|nr:hypothetical protein B0T09DRAFT_338413 [Sordaria sp. MPI-SDFR-AT-0083]